jgi:sulfonate transport system ATP-binding protein
MYQEARLLPWRTVIQNVALGLPGSRAQVRARAEEALAQVGLADRADEWPSRLSGGQRQRVALARALIHRPRLLLLDEPLGALDALTRIEMQRLIEQIWRQHAFTAVLVTHDVAEAVALADRILLIEEGRITFDEVVDLPRPREHGEARFAALERPCSQAPDDRRGAQPPQPVARAGDRDRHRPGAFGDAAGRGGQCCSAHQRPEGTALELGAEVLAIFKSNRSGSRHHRLSVPLADRYQPRR